jgi:type IV secretion system protein VirB10
VFGAKGRKILIPWGSRVCGTYSADIRKGQERLFMVWNEVTRPDGVVITLDSPGADQLGSSGMGGIVDNHFLEIFGSSAAIAIIGAGASNVGVNSGDQYNSSAAYRQSIAQSTAQTSQSVLQQYGSIPPTITVPAGSIVRIYVNRILDFTPVYQQEIESSNQSGVVYLP